MAKSYKQLVEEARAVIGTTTSEELKARVFKNMSSRAAQTLRDDMNVAGPVRLRLVEEAQQRIINTVRALQEAEEIVVSRGDQDVLI